MIKVPLCKINLIFDPLDLNNSLNWKRSFYKVAAKFSFLKTFFTIFKSRDFTIVDLNQWTEKKYIIIHSVIHPCIKDAGCLSVCTEIICL